MLARLVIACACLFVSPAAHAAQITLSGYLNDPANTALAASYGYGDLGAPGFSDDNEIALNMALYAFTVTTPGTFSFESFGHAAGGVEPYFSLFAGIGDAAAFVESNFFDPFIDFNLTGVALAAGDYMIAMGVWVNMSFAENFPDADPTLGDGFIALGDPSRLGFVDPYYYELKIASDDGAFDNPVPSGSTDPHIPEPTTLTLLGIGFAGLVRARRRVRSRAPADHW